MATSKDEDSPTLEALRKRLGITDTVSLPRVGAALPADPFLAFQQRAEQYRKDMEELHAGGSDPHGREEWLRSMRCLGRNW